MLVYHWAARNVQGSTWKKLLPFHLARNQNHGGAVPVVRVSVLLVIGKRYAIGAGHDRRKSITGPGVGDIIKKRIMKYLIHMV